MLTIFGLPKPFKEEFEILQRNAIKSWLNLESDIEIILFCDEKGTKEVAEEFSLLYIPEVAKNEFGTPLVNDIFEKAQKIAKHELLCYVNGDIILMSDFMKAVEKVKNEENFLMVGQRWDFDLKEKINFEKQNWEENLKGEVFRKGRLHSETGIDYFVFRKGFFENIPPFAVGRTVWDEWLLYRAWRRNAKIIDASQVVMAIHQNHPYHYSKESIEAKRNLKLAGGYGHCFTIADATHILTKEGIIKEAPKMSLLRRLETVPFLGFFVRQRKKLTKLIKNEGAFIR